MNRRWSILVATLAAVWAVAFYWACLPPLSIERTEYRAVIHVERLGDYSSQLTELVIRDEATQSVVLQLVPRQKCIGMWALQVREGTNQFSSDPGAKDTGYRVKSPENGATVKFSKNHVYEVTIRGFSMLGEEFLPFSMARTARFVL